MAEILLDTDVIIWLLRGRQETLAKVQRILGGDRPFCSSLSVAEVTVGMRPTEEATTRSLLETFTVVAPDFPIAWRAGELLQAYAQRGTTLDLVDVVIAATCLIRGLPLMTYNVRHFPMADLDLIDLSG